MAGTTVSDLDAAKLAESYSATARETLGRDPVQAARLIKAANELDPSRARHWAACARWIESKARDISWNTCQAVKLAGLAETDREAE